MIINFREEVNLEVGDEVSTTTSEFPYDNYYGGFANREDLIMYADVLRKENDMFSCELSVSANKEISRNCRIAELEEENEQLKKEIAHLKNKLAYKDQHNTDKFRGIEDWARGGF